MEVQETSDHSLGEAPCLAEYAGEKHGPFRHPLSGLSPPANAHPNCTSNNETRSPALPRKARKPDQLRVEWLAREDRQPQSSAKLVSERAFVARAMREVVEQVSSLPGWIACHSSLSC
jgi:hypothetical protein